MTKSVAQSPVVDVTRKIPPFTRLLLCVRAGGICEFDGCIRYLFEHHVTLTEGNFSQLAHIVAFSEDGPRGKSRRPTDIHNIENLMALCPSCHKLIDDNSHKYSRQTLEKFKKNHEQLIRHLTGLKPEKKTSVLVVTSKIGQQTVSVPFEQILEAVNPRYPSSKIPFHIDLTQIPPSSSSFIGAVKDSIKDQLRTFFGPNGDYTKTGHLSLFALGTIPVLMYLGTQLSNKVTLDLYQRHRGKENWTWKTAANKAAFSLKLLQKGKDSASVALLLSLSGTISKSALPSSISKKFSIYELRLTSAAPNPTFLSSRVDLEEFRNSYQIALGEITKTHPRIKAIHMFPAIPAPVAVLCGRELLPKVHPEIWVYDNDKQQGGFLYQATINQI